MQKNVMVTQEFHVDKLVAVSVEHCAHGWPQMMLNLTVWNFSNMIQ
jgi:hypothetical protein